MTLSGVFTTGSDRTKKWAIRDIPYGLNEVLQLRPVKYKFKGTDQDEIGFIAQEVKPIIPEIVYGEEGSMALAYSQITSVLTKAIQEQQIMINELRDQVQQLQELLNQLKTD